MYCGHPDQHFGHTTYSQHGEDLAIMNLFSLMEIHRPSYLDIGAHHPINISNTALLYANGSRGVNIEANPFLMDAFMEYRKEDTNLCIGIGANKGYYKFFMFDRTSGLNSLDGLQLPDAKEFINIHVTTPNDLLETVLKGKWPNFLTIDAEGLDYEILNSCDFSKSSPDVICCEVRIGQELRFKLLMITHGFFCYARFGENLLFVKEKWRSKVY